MLLQLVYNNTLFYKVLFIVATVDGSRRFKWRGSVNKIAKKFGQGNVRSGGTFGVNIEDCPSARDNEVCGCFIVYRRVL